MKKFLSLLFALMATVSINAEDLELYLVGDGTPIGWEGDANQRQSTRMRKVSEGVYQYDGLLKHGGEGFKICGSGWDGYHPDVQGQPIGGSGSGNVTTNNSADWKWNPENTEWKYYTIKLDVNNMIITWQVQESVPVLQPVDGVYYVGSAADLVLLAFMLRNNVNNQSYKVKLTADIDYTIDPELNHASFYALGITEKFPFRGEFDGQNHTITFDFTSYSTRSGFFGTVVGTVHNLKLAGKITASTKNQTSGFCGLLKGEGSKIYNCISTVEIVDAQEGDGTIGGFCAVTYDNATLENCAFYGKINAPARKDNGKFIGWCDSGARTTIKNCLVVADIQFGENSDHYGRNGGTVINCYETTATDPKLASGEMTYQLNGTTGGEDWFQTLNTDAMPTPFSSSAIVYANGTLKCDGSVLSLEGFSNEDTSVIPPHENENGFCKNCGTLDENYKDLVDGAYELASGADFFWFVSMVQAGHTTANARLTADIDYSDYDDLRMTRYDGILDGQNHTLTLNFTATTHNNGVLIGDLYGTVKNLAVAGTITTAFKYAASICRDNRGGTIQNVLSTVNFVLSFSGDNTAGGMVAVNQSGTISNCVFAGSMKGTADVKNCGGIVGWRNGGSVNNCANIATWDIGMDGNTNAIARNGGTQVTNSYVLDGFGGSVEGGTAKIASGIVTGGELTYNLNKTAGTTVYYQKLGEEGDAHPVLTGSDIVYFDGEAYTNTPALPKNEDGFYEIGSVDELKTFGAIVSGGEKDAKGLQTADIDMAGAAFDNLDGFAGTYDGGNFTLSNIGDRALFLTTGNGAVIKNLTITGGERKLTKDSGTGVFIDAVKGNLTMENCVNETPITGNGYNWRAGGIAGVVDVADVTVEFIGCVNKADFTITNQYHYGNHIGGILGFALASGAQVSFTNCLNTGNISSNGGYSIGGICGQTNNSTLTFTNCGNTGTITCRTDLANVNEAGPILGHTYNKAVTLTNCWNIGSTEGNDAYRSLVALIETNNGGSASYTNCYDINRGYDGETDGVSEIAATEAATGELTYKLNQGAGEFIFFQEGEYPTFEGNYVAKIADNGYGTFFVALDAIAIPEGVEAYTGKIEGDVLKMTAIEGTIPAGTAVVLKGEEGFYGFAIAEGVDGIAENDLQGNRAPLTADGTQYILAEVDGTVGFYQAQAQTTIPFAKAFLNIAAENPTVEPAEGVKGYKMVFGDATGINEMTTDNSQQTTVIYDLQGRRVEKATKGIYIVNGKKVLK